MAATNFCSRSPKVAQSISTSTLRSFAHASMCFARTSLPAVTKLLKSQTRSLGLALGAGHRAERVEAGGGAARDDGGAAEELTPGDQACIELLGQAAQTCVGHGRLPGRVEWWGQ